jgi:hypothetical protein
VTALAGYDAAPAAKPELPGGIPLPHDIADRIRRGRAEMLKDSSLRRLCQKFWEGHNYWYLQRGALRVLSTALVDVGAGKPAHRIRGEYNFIAAIVDAKVSASTQRVPGYEVDPSSSDQEDFAAARIAEQVAFYGYDAWHLRRATTKVFTTAFVQREGFSMPYFDQGCGPFIRQPDGRMRGIGQLKVWTGSRSELMWEPGLDFLESRWHAIERAVLVEDIKRLPGYIGGPLGADARTGDLPSDRASEKMARLTDYLERPSERYPEGRRCWIAGNRIVVDFARDPSAPDGADWWEPYPYVDADGVVADEPCIHRISYTVNPEGDDLGLVERLIDLARTIDDCWSKLREWKNRALMPRYMAPAGSNIRTNDVPGGVDFYKPDPVTGLNLIPKLETPPAIPRELFDMLNLAISHMRILAADVDVQPDPNLAAATVNAAIEQSQARWQSFLGDAEDYHSRFMRHCLCIVARFYTEQQIIDIRGRYGWEPPIAFTGADLHSQVNVRVLPGSLEAKSRARIMQEITFIQENWPGAISPEAAWAALHGGSGESLLKSYQLDLACANAMVQKLKGGYKAASALGWRQDMDFGDPALGFMVPGWMPRKVDNVAIWKAVFSDFMKTDFYSRLAADTQHLFDQVYDGLEMQEQQRRMQLIGTEQGVAAQLGQQNAAKPQGQIAAPALAPMTAAQAAPAALTPKQ